MEVVERFINVMVLALAILVMMAAAAVLGMWLMHASSRDEARVPMRSETSIIAPFLGAKGGESNDQRSGVRDGRSRGESGGNE